MKKAISCLILLLLCLLSTLSFSVAETNIAHQIWNEMAKAGNIDLTDCWELMGMYTFGETTGDGYVTLFTTEDGRQIKNSASWRMYPKSEDDITERYFPMLMVLLSYFSESNEVTDITDWLMTREAVALLARYNALPYQSDTKQFKNYDIYIKYDAEHNELYCLMNATKNSERLIISE